LKWTGTGAATLLAGGVTAMAGPFTAADFEKMIPADKRLSPEWVAALFARGSRTVYRGAELEKIGMPIGGLCAGQLYLGGDGKLWHWDLFNKRMGTNDGNYAHPPKPSSPLEQGFAVQVTIDGRRQVRALDRGGFSEISFCGEYPIGYVEYRDPQSPVAVSLEAFSPFVPLDTAASSYPATVMRLTVKNTGSSKARVEVAGWLENVVGLGTKPETGSARQNRVVRSPRLLCVESGVAPQPAAKPRPDVALKFTDRAAVAGGDTNDQGTMTLALLEPAAADRATALVAAGPLPQAVFAGQEPKAAAAPPQRRALIGAAVRVLELGPAEESTATFLITWHFPHVRLVNLNEGGRHYATRFASSSAVAEHLAENFAALAARTRLWHDTWYDSTLPRWFLDRTLLNTSILATSTAHRFASGRFWGWEGVGCCEGTCTHVWQYAHAMARLFPDLERDLRRRTDFGLAQDPKTGMIRHRGEVLGLAVDGQAGCILRAYREHRMSADAGFLRALWPKIKLAMLCLVHMDDGEGLIEGPQHNTLDQPWFGKIAWLSSLYIAAARACEEMAREVGDHEFAARAGDIYRRGRENIDRELFNGEYYIQIADSRHAKSVGSYDGCEIDQVFGQSWAYQVGLGRILAEANVKKALASLWKYNFTPDVASYRRAHKAGRWLAMPGEAGLIMCTWPRGETARVPQGYDYYFNETMSGFEYQVAGHMIWEGMVQEGLAITRAVHDRYHAGRRNPWNEVECGDHYARSMASYGVYLAACGFEHHGPKGYLAFAPRLTPENFRAAFTSAEGWGSYRQKTEGESRSAEIELKWGKLRLKTLGLALPAGAKPQTVAVTVDGRPQASAFTAAEGRLTITLNEAANLEPGQKLAVAIV
jgi:uncharacterized protein (DUF608 family)